MVGTAAAAWTFPTGSSAPARACSTTRPLLATGTDPLSPSLTYRVFARDYTNGLVLYKPLSYAQGVGNGTTADQTATTHQLGGSYRKVNADGTRVRVFKSSGAEIKAA